MGSLDIISGQRFGRLVVLRRDGYIPNGRIGRLKAYLCMCDCGQMKTASGSDLKKGAVQSCGCLRIERNLTAKVTHGFAGKVRSPEYNAYHSMITRTKAISGKDHRVYSSRGISVCDRWISGGFEAFLEDMGPRPSELHSLDRIDGNLGYSPENCRWATRGQQIANRRVTLSDGKPLAEICKETGIKYFTLHSRYARGDRGDVLRRPVDSSSRSGGWVRRHPANNIGE